MAGKTEQGLHINREHPDYRSRRATWRTYSDLYSGGEQLRARADRYLIPRQKEPRDVYAERLSRVFYENYAGSIIDWYTATLYRREPVLEFSGGFESAQKFFADFTEDCDLKGTSITEFLRLRFVDALVYGRSHMLVDFPRLEKIAGTRAEEDAEGASRAYLIGYTPEDLINWSVDAHGNYEWVVLRTSHLTKARMEDARWTASTRWAYYDRENYRIYEQTRTGEDSIFPAAEWADETKDVKLTAAGLHGLAKLKRVPLFDLAVPEGLWLMNRAGLLQLEHFNKSNALSWALTMGLFAMPVIFSERDWNQMVGESYFIQLGPQDKFGWTEPEGKVYQIALENLGMLREEIYRVCYLSQAGGSVSGGDKQSGLSKQWDFSITEQVLRAFGDAVKDCLKRVLKAIVAAREDGIAVNVTGLDEFEIGDFSAQLADAQQLLALGIPSPTLKKEIFKTLAAQYLSDSPQAIKDRISREIETAN